MQVDIPFIHRGDVVRIIDDIAKVFSLQKGHGEWVDDMALVSETDEPHVQTSTLMCRYIHLHVSDGVHSDFNCSLVSIQIVTDSIYCECLAYIWCVSIYMSIALCPSTSQLLMYVGKMGRSGQSL